LFSKSNTWFWYLTTVIKKPNTWFRYVTAVTNFFGRSQVTAHKVSFMKPGGFLGVSNTRNEQFFDSDSVFFSKYIETMVIK
jgi:hypothetical protein